MPIGKGEVIFTGEIVFLQDTNNNILFSSAFVLVVYQDEYENW